MDERLTAPVSYENPLLPICIGSLDRSTEWHQHHVCELLFVRQGGAEIDLEHKTLSMAAGDIILLKHFVPHRIRLQEEELADCISLLFDPPSFLESGTASYVSYFNETSWEDGAIEYWELSSTEASREAFSCISEIHREDQEKKPGYELAVSLYINKLMLLLIRSRTHTLAINPHALEKRRLKPVLDYVEAHIDERISVEDVCAQIHMSYYYFIKFFKKVMGTTFLQYVHIQKIRRAEQLLLAGSLSVNEISNQISMESMAHFYKVFKRLNGCSPKEFQCRMRKPEANSGKKKAAHRILA